MADTSGTHLDILRSECVLEGAGLLVHKAGCVGHVLRQPEVGHSVGFTHAGERRRGEGCLCGVSPTHEFTLGNRKEVFNKI